MGAGEVVAMGGETHLVESNAQLGFGFAPHASTGEVEPAAREERFLSGAEGDFFVGAQRLAEYLQAASERGHGGHGRYRDRRGRQSLPHAAGRGAARGRAKRAGRANFGRAPSRTGAGRPRRCGDAARAARARGGGAAGQAWALTPKLQTVGAAPRKWAGDRAGGACEQRDRGGDGLVATAPGGVRG